MNPHRNRNLLVAGIFIILVVVSIFEVVGAINIVHSTGILQIKTSDPSATLTISQLQREAKYVGLGSARVRLEPGTYLVSASDQGVQTMASVKITKKHTVSETLAIAGLIKQSSRNNKLIAKLPIAGPAGSYYINYYLGYSKGESYPIITISSSSSKGKQAALKWMNYWDFNPSDYKIKYQVVPSTSNTSNYFVGGNP